MGQVIYFLSLSHLFTYSFIMIYESFKVTIENHIATVSLNRPDKANSLHEKAWDELQQVFENLDDTPEVRVIVLAAEGRVFCAGIDLAMLMDIQQLQGVKCEGRKREMLRKTVLKLQDTITAIERCRKPVLAAVHGACVGGGVDIISACDMRYATQNAYFCIKEIDMGMVADLGTLQRLPKIIPVGIANELAYTGRKMYGEEATRIGLTNNVFETKEDMMAHVMDIAKNIASKSPISIRGTKEMLLYTRDHSVADGLNYMAAWNAAMFVSDDLMAAFAASMSKEQAQFSD